MKLFLIILSLTVCFFSIPKLDALAYSPADPYTYIKSSENGRYYARVVGNRKERYLDLFKVESDKKDEFLWRINNFYSFPEQLLISNSQTVIWFSPLFSSHMTENGRQIDYDEIVIIFYGIDKNSLLPAKIQQHKVGDILKNKLSIEESIIFGGSYSWYKKIDIQFGKLHVKLLDDSDVYFKLNSGIKLDKLPEIYKFRQ